MSGSSSGSSTLQTISDAGGVAARQGFKYQDHVAAGFVLDMIQNHTILRVECETADDILVVHRSTTDIYEYVQVKTTEKDAKWTMTEICARDSGHGAKRPTSLIEKSLLTDILPGIACFRIVSRRDVGKPLLPLKTDLITRTKDSAAIDDLATKLQKKRATVSKNGRDIAYWVRNTVWQVEGQVEGLVAKNQQTLLLLAERYGFNPTHAHGIEIYDDLLAWVDRAATASRKFSPEKKILLRYDVMQWWNTQLQETEAARLRTAKPYKCITQTFFAELHHLDENDIRRALSAYDARFELKQWRSEQLADYLANWLPEMTLKASELVDVQQLNLRQKMRAAIRQIEQNRDIHADRLLAEMLLHAVLRHRFGSEPIACKLFYRSAGGTKTFGNAHIVHSTTQDELWLGRAVMATATDYDTVLRIACEELSHVLDPDFLKDEREIILTLREPQHLMPTTLEGALSKYSPIDDLLDVLCIPILIGYDSTVLADGFSSDYRERLTVEIIDFYQRLKTQLPGAVSEIQVHVFLVPIKSVDTLIQQFTDKISWK